MVKNIFLLMICSFVVATASADWKEKFSLKGDIRLRTEGIEDETKLGAEESRWRHRVRARLQFKAMVNDNVNAVLRLATGQNSGGKLADSTSSTNETFDSYGSNKDFNLDLAFVSWKLFDGALKIQGGKMKSSLYRAGGSDILWDSDWTPEGAQISFKNELDSFSVFSNLVGYYIDEDSSGEETGLLGLQARVGFGSLVKFNLGAGYYIINSEGFEVASNKGNSQVMVGAEEVYLYNYNMLEAFLTVSVYLMDQPLMLYSNYINNGEADEEKNAMIFGLQFGETKAVGDFKLDYAYRKIERDSVFGILNDSDFNAGNTDGEGMTFTVKYKFAENSVLGVKYLTSEQVVSQSTNNKYDRYQIDFSFKF